MMPITLANAGEEFIIQRIAGKPEVKAIWLIWVLLSAVM